MGFDVARRHRTAAKFIYICDLRALIQNESWDPAFPVWHLQDCLFRIKLFHWKFECFVTYMSSLLFSQQNHVFQASHLSVCLDPWRRRGWSESGAHVLGERGELRVTSRPSAAPAQSAPQHTSPGGAPANQQQHAARIRLGQPDVSPAAHGEPHCQRFIAHLRVLTQAMCVFNFLMSCRWKIALVKIVSRTQRMRTVGTRWFI